MLWGGAAFYRHSKALMRSARTKDGNCSADLSQTTSSFFDAWLNPDWPAQLERSKGRSATNRSITAWVAAGGAGIVAVTAAALAAGSWWTAAVRAWRTAMRFGSASWGAGCTPPGWGAWGGGCAPPGWLAMMSWHRWHRAARILQAVACTPRSWGWLSLRWMVSVGEGSGRMS